MKDLWLNSWQQTTDYFDAGGPVMLPLLLVSIVMWLLIFNRLFFYRKLWKNDLTSQAALEHLKCNRLPEMKKHQSAVALLVFNFLSLRSQNSQLDCYILDESISFLNRRLDAYLAIIGVLAAIAPLLGLLGTVTGMIATFDVMAVFGTGNARGMAGGISEALITTQTGLLIAIPGLYMQAYLSRQADYLKQRIQRVRYYLQRHL